MILLPELLPREYGVNDYTAQRFTGIIQNALRYGEKLPWLFCAVSGVN